MEDQSRLLDFVPKSSSRATRKAKRALVEGVKAFSRLAVGAAENDSLALVVASAELGADGQQEDTPGGEAAENAEEVVLAGALGPQQGA